MRHLETSAIDAFGDLCRCDGCGKPNNTIDEYGHSFCPYCAGRIAGDLEGLQRGLATMLSGALICALDEGLSADAIREQARDPQGRSPG